MMSTATWVFVVFGGVGVIITVAAVTGWIPLGTSDRAKLVGTVVGALTALGGPVVGFISHQLEALSSETGDVNHIAKTGLQGISDRLSRLEMARTGPTQQVAVEQLEDRLRKLEIVINGQHSPSTGTDQPAGH